MDFARLRTNWTNLGNSDPLWAILGSRQSAGVAWDLDSFFRTGVDFCHYLSRQFQALGVQVARGRALDFGCGYGRISQALASWFSEVVGVDIAESMIEGARKIDRSGGKCRFVVNDRADLTRFETGSFDFVVTVLVLQHMRSDYALGYVREFLRLLRPGGVAFFQVATTLRVPAKPVIAAKSAAHAELPLAALRGAIIPHPGFLALHTAEWQWYAVDLHNLGRHPWCAGTGAHKVQVATRWHASDGTPGEPAILHDLPGDLAPGGTMRMLVPVRAPGEPMRAVLVLHVVVGGAWIELTDLVPARVLAQVEACDPELLRRNLELSGPPPFELPEQAVDAAPRDEAVIEIHGTPVADVVEVVRKAGGEVIDVTEDVWAGPSWLSAHYTVRKR